MFPRRHRPAALYLLLAELPKTLGLVEARS